MTAVQGGDTVTAHPVLAFLEARWADLQATALDASTANGREWTFHYQPIDNALITGDLDGPFSNVVAFDEGAPNEYQAQHICLHDPASVLRRIAAERKIVDRYLNDTDHDTYGVVDPGFALWAQWTIQTLAEGHGWENPDA